MNSRLPRALTLACLLTSLALATAGAAHAQSAAPNGPPVTRVLVVGDSWAKLYWDNRSLRTVFAAQGHPQYIEKGDNTTEDGTTAADWSTAAYLQSITDELTQNPTIDTVLLSIGGNDFLAGQSGGGWFRGISPMALENLYTQILDDTETVIDHILAQRPDLEVVLSSYDYPNFVDTLGGIVGIFCTDLWNDLANPTPEEINLAAQDLTARIQTFADGKARTAAVNHLGLMQFLYGFPSMGIQPGDLLPPGDVTLPSPQASLRFFGADCFHLNSTGYETLAQNLWYEYFLYRFGLAVFADGFESGTLGSWSAAVP